jgi:hypothetical protein
MANLVTLKLNILFGEFVIGEQVVSGTTVSTVQLVDQTTKIITVNEPSFGEFKTGAAIVGLTSKATATISGAPGISGLFDLFNTFSGKIPAEFSFSDLIMNTPVAPEFKILGTEEQPGPSSTSSAFDNAAILENPSKLIDPTLTETRTNPLNANSNPGAATPNDRKIIPVGNEPVKEFEGEYPYNKSYRSEGGHLIEVDDTPSQQRLLNQHVTGTYTEMLPEGDFVTKVIGDNYTIVCHDDIVSIEGAARIVIKGDCSLAIGGTMTIEAEKGINIATPGDFRVKAKSIHMESTGGNISTKSSASTLITSTENLDIKSKANHIDSTQITSMTIGEQFIVDAKKISQHSTTDIALVSDAKTSIQSTAETNIKSGAAVNVEGAGNINLKAPLVASSPIDTATLDVTTANITTLNAGTTNLTGTHNTPGDTNNIKGSTTASVTVPVAAAAAVLDAPVVAEESKGSGITFVADVSKIMELTDDDPEARHAAMQHAIDNGIMSKDQVDQSSSPESSDTSGPSSDVSDTGGAPTGGTPLMRNATITNVGNNPSDNVRLSTHFQLGQLSSNAKLSKCPVRAFNGLSAEQIVQNLQLLAQNCLEPMFKKNPTIWVNSGFRSYVPNSPGASKTSQHMLGQAADCQFRIPDSDYYDLAVWCKNNIPVFDQLILEYSGNNPWIHISYSKTRARKDIKTCKPGGSYISGLHKLR